MSKVSFRARALDVTKAMPVYRDTEIPDIPDFATINRSVPLMPTGMEKEEETEHHLQRALSAQQVYGTSETLVIPIPEIVSDLDHYNKLYEGDYKQLKQYVHMQAIGLDQDIPDYDMDSDDETWIKEQGRRVDISPGKFEEMMDRLEKGSGQQVVTLHEAKALLKEDDDLIIAVYDYWLNKRLNTKHPLILTVKSEKRDGSTTNNPYVAFRRRSEKMQTRKNRKNDEVSYERMLKLRRDVNRALTVIEMMKRREKTKKEMLQLTIEILEKRHSMGDYSGEYLAAAEKERLSKPVVPRAPVKSHWPARQTENLPTKKKREYKKRRVKPEVPREPKKVTHVIPTNHFTNVEVIQPDIYSSEYDSPAASPSDHEDETDPDGPFSFRRRKSCTYLAPLSSRGDHISRDVRHRYNLLSLPPPYRCVGYGRRRVGRGGRLLVDRVETEWDDTLQSLEDLDTSCTKATSSDYVVYIRDRKIKHFRPHTPPPAPPVFHPPSSHLPTSHYHPTTDFQAHREELIRLRQLHQQLLLRSDSTSLTDSTHSRTHLSTIDTAGAKFAASAFVDTIQLQKSLELAKKTLAAKSLGSPGFAGTFVSPVLPVHTPILSPLVTGGYGQGSQGHHGHTPILSPMVTAPTTISVIPSSSFVNSSSSYPIVPTVSLVNGPSLTERCTVRPSAPRHPSPPPTVLQLHYPTSATLSHLSQLTKPANKAQILTHTNSLLTLTPPNGTSQTLLKSASSLSTHEDTLPLRGLTNDTPIAMDVT